MPQVIPPENTTRAAAYALWMKAPNPMVTLVKTFDVTRLVKLSKRRQLKFNLLLCYCIGKAASKVKEFFLLPVGQDLVQYEQLAVNLIVRNKTGEVSSCDLLYTDDLEAFARDYLKYTAEVAESCKDRDLSGDCMVIGSSAIVETEIDSAVGIYSGFFNNPFLIWGRYKKRWFKYSLPISFQFHHTQMDGAHAGRFLALLQEAIDRLK